MQNAYDLLPALEVPPDGSLLPAGHPFYPVAAVHEPDSHLPLLSQLGKSHLEVRVFPTEGVGSLEVCDLCHRVRQVPDTSGEISYSWLMLILLLIFV